MSITEKISLRLMYETHEIYHENFNQEGIKAGVQRNVTCRGGYFLGFVGYPITSLLDLFFGSITAIGSILTAGCIKPLNRTAFTLTEGGGKGLLSGTFTSLIGLINPKAPIEIAEGANGIINEIVGKKLATFACDLREADNFFANHVLSRLAYLGFALSSIVTRIIDLVIGIFAAIGSLLTLGKIRKVNTWAHEGLKVSLLINDLYFGVVRTINPWTNFRTANSWTNFPK